MITRFLLAALAAFAIATMPARASDESSAAQPTLELAQAGCAAAARQAAAQTGGQVIGSPRMVNENGQTICVIQLLVSDPNGQNPPTRQTVRIRIN